MCKPNEPLFLSENDGGRMTPNGLLQLLRRIGNRAAVHCHPHKFRRTCAVTLYRAGMQLADIALLLGHSDLETLKGYLDLQAQDGLQAHEKAGPVETLLGHLIGGSSGRRNVCITSRRPCTPTSASVAPAPIDSGASWSLDDPGRGMARSESSGKRGSNFRRELVWLLRLLRCQLEGLRGRRHLDLCPFQQLLDAVNLDTAVVPKSPGRVKMVRRQPLPSSCPFTARTR